MTGNAQRVVLNEDVGQVVAEAKPNTAFEVMESAFDIQQREQRPMTLQEALRVIAEISRKIEARDVQ